MKRKRLSWSNRYKRFFLSECTALIAALASVLVMPVIYHFGTSSGSLDPAGLFDLLMRLLLILTLFYALTGKLPANAKEREKDPRLLISTNTVKRLFDKDAFVYYSGNAEQLVAFGQPRKGWENYYFFNRHCACLVGEDLAAVLTPRLGSDGDPFLTFKGRKVSYGLHGFLSGVAVEIVE